MPVITPDETNTKLFQAKQLPSRDIAIPSYRANCTRCPWIYGASAVDEGVRVELVKARAEGHVYKTGHVVEMYFDIIGQLLERVYPKRADEAK